MELIKDYEFKQEEACSKCGSTNVNLMDNVYYVFLYRFAAFLCLITVFLIPFAIGLYVAANKMKKKPIGMIQCLDCGKCKNYKKGELYEV